ncbi:glycosyltransferase family 2 protein [Eggerthella sinensis]|uniref:glycosyltransferase family 2 protein n=1 Tax=Eggerthella sinensis TaxID=242230 RepID=UPI00266CD413|nr:glycosyltransferase family 2 protein [Eggerthella sinensis]
MERERANPIVSVIVPTYNADEFVAQCIDSVLGQSLSDFELICVDDGSTDGTCALVEERAQRDARVSLIRQANAGPGVARNAGLDRARGTYVYCLDADDYLERDMLLQCARALDETGADMALVAFRTFNQRVGRAFPAEWGMRHEEVYPAYPAGTFTWETAPELFFETVQNVPWNKVVRRSLLEERGIRFQELRLTEDLMYSLPAAVASGSIVRIAQPLMVHREFAGTNAMADKGRYPLDVLEAFEALGAWLRGAGLYEQLRAAYQTWLLDAVYYNLPTYRDHEGFVAAYARLTAEDLAAFDLAEVDPREVRDPRYRALLEGLRTGSRERFLLACANIEAAEVQEQKCGFQDAQVSIKWLAQRLKDRLRS